MLELYVVSTLIIYVFYELSFALVLLSSLFKKEGALSV